jgi:acetyltransferase EpsM
VIIEIIEKSGNFIKGLYDDDPAKKSLLNYKVVSDKGVLSIPDAEWLIAIGNNVVRKKIATENSLLYGIAVDVNSHISKTTEVGIGTVVMPGVTINSSTVTGKHCIINTNASVDHDCVLGDYVHISPNATLCGGVIIGEGTHVGAGSVIIPGIRVGQWATIGAGSVIIKDVPDHVTIVGNPGRII